MPVRTKQFHLCEFSRGRRTVKRYEMYLCATVSLLFCMLPKVVISHGGEKIDPRAVQVRESAIVNGKQNVRRERSRRFYPRSRFWGSRPVSRITHLRIDICVPRRLINIGARAKVLEGYSVITHVTPLRKIPAGTCASRGGFVIRDARGFQ
jgi:hypothetical protein